MNKANSFRTALTAALPSLATDPDKLLVFIDAGRVIATDAPSLSFEYRFTLNAILLDFAGDADAVFVALLAWVKRNQSDLLSNETTRKDGISFEAEHLTNDTCDLSIKLQLSESVVVGADDQGAQTITHIDEPVFEWNLDSFIG
jgi:hypothetical protein